MRHNDSFYSKSLYLHSLCGDNSEFQNWFRVCWQRLRSFFFVSKDVGERKRWWYLFSGNLQDGGVRDENARGREHPGKKDRQNLSSNGQEQGRQTKPRRVHWRGEERPLNCASFAVRPPISRTMNFPLLTWTFSFYVDFMISSI